MYAVYRPIRYIVQVPHYCGRSVVKSASGLPTCTPSSQLPHCAGDDLARRRRCLLLEAKNRYHSEPDLIDAVHASWLDDRQFASHGHPLAKQPQSVAAISDTCLRPVA